MMNLDEDIYGDSPLGYLGDSPLGYLGARSWWKSSPQLQKKTMYLMENGIPFNEVDGDFDKHIREVLINHQNISNTVLPLSWTIKYDNPHELRHYLSDVPNFDRLLTYQWFMNNRDIHSLLLDLAEEGQAKNVIVYEDEEHFIIHLNHLKSTNSME